ncbi:MAG: hypothetical protein ABL893_04015 [Hyphomicrobium sp.]
MSFDARQATRKRQLERLVLVFQAVAVAYIAMHLAIVWLAFGHAGAVSAFVTLVTLGFGDLYWLIRWAQELGLTGETYVAAAAALVCFASWITRPMFNRWAAGFTKDMLADTAQELKSIQRGIEAHELPPSDKNPRGGPDAA